MASPSVIGSTLYFLKFLGQSMVHRNGNIFMIMADTARLIVLSAKTDGMFTRSAFEKNSKTFSPSDLDVDCSAQSFMITGGNSGIGFASALEIARRGGTLHMLCRNEGRALIAKKQIETETKNNKIYTHIVDVSLPRKINEFAKSFKNSGVKLDGLIINATCLLDDRFITRTEDGLEKHFATNVLCPYVLTQQLLPLLKSSSNKARVVLVSTASALLDKLDCRDLNFEKARGYCGMRAFIQTKRQQMVLFEQLAQSNSTVFFGSAHPGWTDTPLVRTSMNDYYKLMNENLRKPSQAADTVVWLALCPKVTNGPSGEFYFDRAIYPKHLPYCRTRTSRDAEIEFMSKVNTFAKGMGIQFQS